MVGCPDLACAILACSTFSIPGHALHEKGLQRSKKRQLEICKKKKCCLLLSRATTSRCDFSLVYIGSPLFVVLESRSKNCRRCFGMQGRRVSLGRIIPSAPCPAPPCSIPPPINAPPHTSPPVVCPVLVFGRSKVDVG